MPIPTGGGTLVTGPNAISPGSSYRPPPNPWEQFLSSLGGAFGSQTDPTGALAGIMSNMTSDQQGELRAQQGFGLQRIGLERQGQGITSGALARQLPLLASQYGLQMQGLSDQRHGAMRSALEGKHDFIGDRATAGSVATSGTRRGVADIRYSLAQQLRGIGRQKKSDTLAYRESVADIGDAQKQLGLQAKGLGISEAELRNRVQHGLAQAGLQNFFNVDQLYQMASSNDMQQLQFAGGLLQMILGGATGG